MPDVPTIDAHVHLWDPTRFRMSWLDSRPLLDRPYGLPEYREATDGLGVAGLVFIQTEVEPPYALMEARWVDGLAEEDSIVQAIVPWAPLEFGEQAGAYLDELRTIGARIKGVRRIIQYEPDSHFALQPRFVRGVQMLAEYGLSFDICIDYRQMAQTIELVRQCPNTSFILDHIGKPDIRHGMLDPWREQITGLASFPNVFCKVSGMVTEADPERWTIEDLQPFVEHVLQAFGEDRVAFGSDWPVVLEASSYRRWVEALDALTGRLSPEAKRKLWAGNARRFYRIGQKS